MSLPVLYTFYDSDRNPIARTISRAFKMFYLNDESEKREAVLALLRVVELSEEKPDKWSILERIAFVQIENSKNLQPVEAVVARAEQEAGFTDLLVARIKKAFPNPVRSNDPKQPSADEDHNNG